MWWIGGSSGHGHVALSAGNGMCWSGDIRRGGYFDLVPIAEIGRRWGLQFVGWTRDINGVTVLPRPAPTPAPTPTPAKLQRPPRIRTAMAELRQARAYAKEHDLPRLAQLRKAMRVLRSIPKG